MMFERIPNLEYGYLELHVFWPREHHPTMYSTRCIARPETGATTYILLDSSVASCALGGRLTLLSRMMMMIPTDLNCLLSGDGLHRMPSLPFFFALVSISLYYYRGVIPSSLRYLDFAFRSSCSLLPLPSVIGRLCTAITARLC